jgi:hypothetical protein
MECWNCETVINGKPWDHLKDINEVSEDGKIVRVDKYVCSYRCCKRLHEDHKFPKNLWQHIVNKEDYNGLISPILPTNDNKFCLLTHDELKNMDIEDVEKYYTERDEQLYLDPEMITIHDEIINEDKRTEFLECDNESEEYDDY